MHHQRRDEEVAQEEQRPVGRLAVEPCQQRQRVGACGEGIVSGARRAARSAGTGRRSDRRTPGSRRASAPAGSAPCRARRRRSSRPAALRHSRYPLMKLKAATLARPSVSDQIVPRSAKEAPSDRIDGLPAPGCTWTLIMKKMQKTRHTWICRRSARSIWSLITRAPGKTLCDTTRLDQISTLCNETGASALTRRRVPGRAPRRPVLRGVEIDQRRSSRGRHLGHELPGRGQHVPRAMVGSARRPGAMFRGARTVFRRSQPGRHPPFDRLRARSEMAAATAGA